MCFRSVTEGYWYYVNLYYGMLHTTEKITCIAHPYASRTWHLIDVAMHTVWKLADTACLPSRRNRKWLFFLVCCTAVSKLTATLRLSPFVSHTSATLKFKYKSLEQRILGATTPCIRVCVCVYIYIYIYTHTHTHIYIYTHMVYEVWSWSSMHLSTVALDFIISLL
jgi:hypothetical protein